MCFMFCGVHIKSIIEVGFYQTIKLHFDNVGPSYVTMRRKLYFKSILFPILLFLEGSQLFYVSHDAAFFLKLVKFWQLSSNFFKFYS